MKYYFGIPQIPTIATKKVDNYTVLYSKLPPPPSFLDKKLQDEYRLFLLESCRLYVDGIIDKEELQSYYQLVSLAHNNLLIHRDKIEMYFKKYINSLFTSNKKSIEKTPPPQNISEVVIDLMLSELNINSILQHTNLDTQQVDMQSISNDVKLEKINAVKKLHDIVLFFVEYYNRHESL